MPGSNGVIVKTDHLTKLFGNLVAVDDLSLEVYKGEIFGFLGPNGSGKSTTMGMILGLIAPTSGSVEVFGLNVQNNLTQILPRVGAMMETPGLYPYLSGWDNLKVFARLSDHIPDSRIAEVLDLVDLGARAVDKFSNYSTGMKQRLALACALLHDPELIILDEPTNGLDPAGMKEIRELIIGLGNQGKTIFLNSHLLHEVEQVCQRVAIIKNGRVIVQGLVKDLLSTGNVLQVRVNDPDKAVSVLQRYDWIASVIKKDEYLLLDVKQDKAADVSAVLAKEGIYASEIKAKQNSLEEYFLEQTEEKASV